MRASAEVVVPAGECSAGYGRLPLLNTCNACSNLPYKITFQTYNSSRRKLTRSLYCVRTYKNSCNDCVNTSLYLLNGT